MRNKEREGGREGEIKRGKEGRTEEGDTQFFLFGRLAPSAKIKVCRIYVS